MRGFTGEFGKLLLLLTLLFTALRSRLTGAVPVQGEQTGRDTFEKVSDADRILSIEDVEAVGWKNAAKSMT